MKATNNSLKTLPRIHITVDILHTLMEDFDVVDTSVRQALKFANNSAKSKEIRKRAVELMTHLTAQNTHFINEYDQD